MRTVTTTEEMRPHNRRAPFIRLRGNWLKAFGFKAGATVYIYETADGILLSPNPPHPIEIPSIEVIKAEFRALGIPTEKAVK